MEPVTKDKYLSFVIQHYNDIQALNELVDIAKSKFPQVVDRAVGDAIYALKSSFLRDQGLKVVVDKYEVWWSDVELYDDESGIGPYFSYEFGSESSKWKWIASEDPADAREAGYLCLYVETTGLSKKEKATTVEKWFSI